MQNWKWLKTQQEGQFFERKSCYDYSGQKPKLRSAREVARDVAETLAAMANADGGALDLGIEDDGTPTGLNYPPDRLNVILWAPQRLVHPPLKARHHQPQVSITPIPDELRKCIDRLPEGGYLTNATARQILGVSRVKAARLLREWVNLGFLERCGEKRGTHYYVTPEAYKSLSARYESPSLRTDHNESDS